MANAPIQVDFGSGVRNDHAQRANCGPHELLHQEDEGHYWQTQETDPDFDKLAKIEFFAGLYLSPDGPVIPNTVIDSMVVNAAKKLREGPAAKSGRFCFEAAPAPV